MLKIVILSDTHCQHDHVKVPVGDVLIHCGDFTHHGKLDKVISFLDWMDRQPHKHKLIIPGNHELSFEEHPDTIEDLLMDYPRIRDITMETWEIEGYFFFGFPYTPNFFDWAFMPEPGPRMQAYIDQIPPDTDILISHGPAQGILDRNHRGDHCGCPQLRDKVQQIKPIVHAFGHIHPASGMMAGAYRDSPTVSINAAICNHVNKPKNPARVICLP